jgi:O-antigen/teichoic acid export membrane protein
MEAFWCILIFTVPFVVVTVPVTSLFCRHHLAHTKRVSFATILPAIIIAAPLTMLVGCLFVEFDWDRAWFDFFGYGLPRQTSAMMWLWAVFICTLTSLGVLIYYRRRSKRYETPVA